MKKDQVDVKIGLSIRAARTKRSWTMDDLAEKAGLSSNFIGNLERGEKSATGRTLARIAKAFGEKPDYWFRGF